MKENSDADNIYDLANIHKNKEREQRQMRATTKINPKAQEIIKKI